MQSAQWQTAVIPSSNKSLICDACSDGDEKVRAMAEWARNKLGI